VAGDPVEAHPLDGVRRRVVWHLIAAALLPALAGLAGLHYLP